MTRVSNFQALTNMSPSALWNFCQQNPKSVQEIIKQTSPKTAREFLAKILNSNNIKPVLILSSGKYVLSSTLLLKNLLNTSYEAHDNGLDVNLNFYPVRDNQGPIIYLDILNRDNSYGESYGKNIVIEVGTHPSEYGGPASIPTLIESISERVCRKGKKMSE